jgi:peptide/nickel transport system ATP-binding protein
MNGKNDILLEVRDLHVSFPIDAGVVKAVDGVSFSVRKGETFGIVGESGCGKSVSTKSIMQIVPPPGVVSGEIRLHERAGKVLDEPIDIVELRRNSTEMRSIRGGDISMIFQEPMVAFSPVHTIGNQIIEAITLHGEKNKRRARELGISMLEKVGISNPRQRFDEYPFQLSGGMRQRAMIAMALSCNPSLLIADEPTTALDVTIQAQVLDLIKDLRKSLSMSVIYITHDLGVIAETADRVAVMYLGEIVEIADVENVFNSPLHPYTRGLLNSIPKIKLTGRGRLETIPGNVPMPIDLPVQCKFFSRCDVAIKGVCDSHNPQLAEIKDNHNVSCFKYAQCLEKIHE